MIELPTHRSPSIRSRRTLERAIADRNTQIAAAGAIAAGAALAAGKAVTALRSNDHEDAPSRRYRLRRKERPADGLRRIAIGRADDALEHLRDDESSGNATAVHEARKDMKKLRAVLRLLRGELGNGVYRRENTRFRDAGRLLSGARDAEVKLETLESLYERFGDESPAAGLKPLTAALDAEREAATKGLSPDPNGGPMTEAAVEIERGRTAVQKWPLKSNDWELVRSGLERTYGRGRDALAALLTEPTAERVHEWRKRVKDLWYQLRILRNTWPAVIGPMADEAHELADLLGDHHDLTVLDEDVSSRKGPIASDDLKQLRKLIKRRQRELLENALALGRRLYADKPKAFERRLGEYWAAWR